MNKKIDPKLFEKLGSAAHPLGLGHQFRLGWGDQFHLGLGDQFHSGSVGSMGQEHPALQLVLPRGGHCCCTERLRQGRFRFNSTV